MRKIMMITLMMCMLGLGFAGCQDVKKVINPNAELYLETDKFVTSLQTTYEHYGIFSEEHTVITKDGLYRIMPTGRLINVKIQKVVSDAEYEKLKNDLAKHYKGDARVNEVYICGGGTIMIDCRN